MEHDLDEEHDDETGGESDSFNVLLGSAHQFSGVVLPEEILVLGQDTAEGFLTHAPLHGRADAVGGELLYVLGYTRDEINYQHFLYCYLLSKKLDAYVLAPVYPLAPLHDVNESIEKITELYKSLIDLNTNLILMGDSAGGGFILSFSQYIKTINLTQPDHIITFSPWVDISMSNSPYNDENDPILGEIGLREIGKSWAGNLDTKDYKVSPLFGNVANQAPTLIFAGDNEIFYKDIKLYVEKLEENDVNVKFITGKGLFHIYPLFPIPEAKKAFKEIKKEIMA